MRFKIKLAIISIYILAFSGWLIQLSGDKNLNSYILLGVDILIFYLGLSTIKRNSFNLLSIIIIFTISVLNYLTHDYNVLTLVNGVREILLSALLFSFYESLTTPFQILLNSYFKKFIYIFLVAQIPVCLYQFILNGAGDAVGGTLGVGNSGILTLLVIPMVYYRIRQQQPSMGVKAYYNSAFLLPLFVNETKISFMLIPMMFLCLSQIKKVSTLVTGFMGAFMFFIALNSFYSNGDIQSKNPFEEMYNEDFLEHYLMSDVEQGIDVPRFTKIAMAIDLLSKNSTDFLLGIEVGAFKGGTTISLSHFAKQYDWLLLGSRPYAFYLLVTGGWTLSIFMIYFLIRKSFSNRSSDTDYRFLILLTTLFIVILFYNDAFRSQIFCFLYVYFVFVSKKGLFKNIL